MIKKSAIRLSLMVFGLVVCLTVPDCRTSEEKVSGADGGATSSDVVRKVTQRLKRITIPEMTFRPPATIADVIGFLKQASIDGGSVLLGRTSTSDNKWVHVGFLTLKRQRISGVPTKDAKRRLTP